MFNKAFGDISEFSSSIFDGKHMTQVSLNKMIIRKASQNLYAAVR